MFSHYLYEILLRFLAFFNKRPLDPTVCRQSRGELHTISVLLP